MGTQELAGLSRCNPNEDMLGWPSGPEGAGTKGIVPLVIWNLQP